MAPPIDVSHCSTGLVLASWRGVSFNVWRRAMDQPSLRLARAHLREMRARNPKGYVSMVLFPAQGRDIKFGVSDALRDEVAGIVREASGSVRASAIVLEGGGFFAAAMRTAGSGLTLVARPTYPVKFFETIDGAAAWAAAVEPVDPSLSAAALLEATRAALACEP